MYGGVVDLVSFCHMSLLNGSNGWWLIVAKRLSNLSWKVQLESILFHSIGLQKACDRFEGSGHLILLMLNITWGVQATSGEQGPKLSENRSHPWCTAPYLLPVFSNFTSVPHPISELHSCRRRLRHRKPIFNLCHLDTVGNMHWLDVIIECAII